jgi:hypothetical protein
VERLLRHLPLSILLLQAGLALGVVIIPVVAVLVDLEQLLDLP